MTKNTQHTYKQETKLFALLLYYFRTRIQQTSGIVVKMKVVWFSAVLVLLLPVVLLTRSIKP